MGYISNGKTSTVTVFDLKTLKVVSNFPSAGEKPDAILYDRFSKNLFVCNGGSNSVALFDASSFLLKNVVTLPGAPEFAVSGLNGFVYINIEDKGSLVKIDAVNQKLVAEWGLEPGTTPTGLAIDVANGLLFSGCRGNKAIEVVDVKSGKVVQTLPIGAGVDGVMFDPFTATVFSSNGEGNVSIYREKGNREFKLLQTLVTKKGSKTLGIVIK